MLTNDTIRKAGEAILTYKPLPAPKAFHKNPAKFRWLLGGNRSGKSESNTGYDLCSFALGIHPYRPTPPNAVIWCVTDTWSLVGKILYEEKILKYLPESQVANVVWHNKAENIPKQIDLINGNTIELKSYDQGRRSFQGRAIDAFYGDEQCKSDALGIWQEIQARLLDKSGFSAQTMTPIVFQPWFEERIKNLPPSDEVFYANLEDNRKSRGGYIDDAEIDLMIAEWPDSVKETRIKGHFAAFLGAVFRDFTKDTHVIKPFEIPPEWSRFRAIDFGFNNPFACLWLARDGDQRWYVYAEYEQARELLGCHAERIKQISKGNRYRMTWADHDAQGRAELNALGIMTTPARKDVNLGIESVQACLKVQPDGKPRLYIFDTCRNTIRAMQGYRWAEGTDNADAKDMPLKIDDHTIDSLRYAIYGIEGK
jgi:phage terminase large subunit-like protein